MVKDKKILITGGLGFIGFNAALHFCQNNRVCVVDDCSRVGVVKNIEKLEKLNVEIHQIDISNFKELRNVFYSFHPDIVIHLAAQVAVTLSVDNPYRDFQSNIQGSFNLLELARTSQNKPIMLYASTNKVYGGKQQKTKLKNGRYALSNNEKGYSEDKQLSFETPYGCSKGAADQYFIDYAYSYQVPTVVFRQSCIYGPYQFGVDPLQFLGMAIKFVMCCILMI